MVYNLLVVALVVIGLVKAIWAVYDQCTYWKRRRAPRLPTAPMLGSGWQMFFRKMSIPEFSQYQYDYRKDVRYIGSMDFFTPTVVIRDPALIRDLGIKYFEHFTDHQNFVDEEMDPIFGKNVFSLRGERWREMRNTLSPTFTASKMRFMFELVSKCCKEFTDYLYDHPEQFTTIEAKDIFTRYTNDVIATAAFGISVNSLKNQNNEFYLKGVDASNFGGFFKFIKFLMFRMSPRLTKMMGLTFFTKDTTKFFYNVVSETVRTRDEQNIVRPDMIHMLMQARDKDKPSTHQMTIDDIVAQAFIFFLAGFDTASTLMCYTVYELALNPDIQERLREEVDRYMTEGNGEISYEALTKMEYLEMVTSEALRKYPPVPFIDRSCVQKFELSPAAPGYDSITIKPGDVLGFPVYGMHHDPKYFPEPEKFDPERFNEQNKDKIDPYVYLPFGIGPRKCIGNRFALMEAKLLTANLLHRFYLKRIAKTTVPIVYSKKNFSMNPEHGFWIGLEKRER
nr:cytochrome P450 9e2-like [Megalopta genalis]